jgi:hypothetical protein
MVEATGHSRFRISIRTLMIAVALCAVLLAPVVYVFRHFEAKARAARMAELVAREEADKARYLAQLRSAQAALGTASLGNTLQPKAGSLWAALSINHAIFEAGQTKDLRIEFTLVNDGDKVIDTKIQESRIKINSEELADSALVLGRVSTDASFKALSPGDSLQFSLLLGDRFQAPGTYRVSWKGAGFQSSEIVLRIVPEKAD